MADDRTSQSVSYWASALGIDPNLIWAVINTESGGNPNVVGAAGEIGLMQLMPPTAAYYGVSSDQLYDPYYNVQAGASYLKDMIDKYGLEGGIQAYNLGETKYLAGLTSPTYLAKVIGSYTPTVAGLGIVEAGLGSNITILILIGIGIGIIMKMRKKGR